MPSMQPTTEYGHYDIDCISAQRSEHDPFPPKTYPKRRCAHPGCITPLNSYHPGKYCYQHEEIHKPKKPEVILPRPIDPLSVVRPQYTGRNCKHVVVNIYQGEDAKLAPLKGYQSKMDISRSYGYNSFSEAVAGLYARFGSVSKVSSIFGVGNEGILRVLYDLGLREKNPRSKRVKIRQEP